MNIVNLSLLFSLVPLAVASIDINDLVSKAHQTIQEEAAKQFELGGTSKLSRKRTPFSRAMDARNTLFERSLELLQKEMSNASESERAKIVAELEKVRFGDFMGNASLAPSDRTFIQNTYNVDDSCGKNFIDCSQVSPQFRTFDGSCNNLSPGQQWWGASNIPFRRYVRPAYHNLDQNTPRGDLANRPYGFNQLVYPQCQINISPNLPNARLLSRIFHNDVDHPTNRITHMVPQFGQFLDHDLSLTAESDIDNCCQGFQSSNCFPIAVPSNDPFFNKNCLEFHRSSAFCLSSSTYREQFNTITAFVDASNVYGSDKATADSLRTFSNGKLKITASNAGKELLPRLFNSENNQNEFTGGDSRARENPGLTALHTLFVREHNRIATEIKARRSFWSDERIYQTARKIVGAEMQNIVYGEYLTAVLGQNTMLNYALNRDANYDYFNNIDPSIKNMFATAAYRFGHSMIQGDIRVSQLTNVNNGYTFKLSDNFFNDNEYLADNGFGLEKLIYGMTFQLAQNAERYVTGELTNKLFKEQGQTFGEDLISRNIQRGRDHGLPGYNEAREFCGLPKLCDWSDASYDSNLFYRHHWDTLKQLYDNPGDMDLFTAGIAEKPVAGGVTGPTFNCIKAKQFQDLKYGDRFFFTHRNTGSAGFTFNQRQNLLNRHLADIICDNTDIDVILSNVFDASSFTFQCSAETNLLNVNLFI